MTEVVEKDTVKNKLSQKNSLRSSLIILGFAILLPVLIGTFKATWGIIGVHMRYSDGERKIKLVKVANKGLIWQTFEMEGIVAAGPGIATTYIWDFSIDNDDPDKEAMLREINHAFESGKTIRVRYEQRAGSVPWRSETNYWLKEVTYLE